MIVRLFPSPRLSCAEQAVEFEGVPYRGVNPEALG